MKSGIEKIKLVKQQKVNKVCAVTEQHRSTDLKEDEDREFM